jgi:hypothetical protein
MFDGISVDKEEFYEKVKSLKETIKSLFKNKLNNYNYIKSFFIINNKI